MGEVFLKCANCIAVYESFYFIPFLKGSWTTNTNAAQPASEQIEPEKPSEQATPDEQKQQPDGLAPPLPLSPSCEGTTLDRESCEKKSGKNV